MAIKSVTVMIALRQLTSGFTRNFFVLNVAEISPEISLTLILSYSAGESNIDSVGFLLSLPTEMGCDTRPGLKWEIRARTLSPSTKIV